MYEQLLRHIVSINQWRKKHISQTGFLMAAAAIVGALGGIAASLLKKATHLVADYLQNGLTGEYKFYLYFVFPLLGIFLTVFYVKIFIRKHKFQQGIPPLINSISWNRSKLPFHNVYSQIISSAITVGMGGSAGLESPSVASGASFGSNLGRWFGLDYRDTTLLLACGGAAGISGAFDSPIAGMVFALEVLLPTISIPTIIPLLISSAVASVVSWMVYNQPLFVYVADTWETDGFWIYIVFGILAGLYSAYYSYMNELMHHSFNRIKNIYTKAWIGGISLGILIALFPSLYGEGYINIQQLLDGHYTSLLNNSLFSDYQGYTWAIILFAILSLLGKTTACGVTMSCGGNGGMFGPSVVIGGLLGFVFAFTLNQAGVADLNITHFIVVGMAASVSGAMHAPLTGVFLAAEITGGYVLMVPLMIVSALAYIINKSIRKYSIYTKDLANEGKLISTENKDSSILSHLHLRYMIERDYPLLLAKDTPLSRKDDIVHSDKTVFPVVDVHDTLLGVIRVEQLLEYVFSKDEAIYNQPFSHMVQPAENAIKIDAPMEEVIQLMDKRDLHLVPVTSTDGKYMGFVSRDTVFSKYRKLLIRQNDLI